jgi:tetratricopeptide (TPR) repeat protein
MLVPVIGLVQVGDQAWADRYTYLPLIGLFIIAVWGAADAVIKVTGADTLKGGHRTPFGVHALACSLSGLAAIAMLAMTHKQLIYWKNTRTLFEHAAQVTEKNAKAITILGSLLANEGKMDEAMAHYAEALRYQPDDPETHFSRANALEKQGNLDESITEYRKALWFRPIAEETHVFLGVALAKQKKYEQAAAEYKAALALNPDSALAHNDLGKLLHTQGRLDEAIDHYSAALKINPNLAPAHNNLGVILLQQGRISEALVHLKEAVRLRPGDVESDYNLARALNQEQKWSEAVEIFSRLAPHAPDDSELHSQFALALAHCGKTREAMSHYAHALLRQPDLAEALDGLAWILSTNPHSEFRNGQQAIPMAERACELTAEKDPEKLRTLAAAYAEAGRFEDATAKAQKADQLARAAGQQELAESCRRLLESFAAGTAWRE